MRKKLLILLILPLLVLVGCINRSGPNYIESVDLSINNELMEGRLEYFNEAENSWISFDNYQEKQRTQVYYTFDVPLNKDLKIIFNFYNPKITLKDVKVISSRNLYYNTNKTHYYYPEEKENDNTKVIIIIDDFDGTFNVLKVTSWLSDEGIKYQGQKHKGGNYTIWGIHLNII